MPATSSPRAVSFTALRLAALTGALALAGCVGGSGGGTASAAGGCAAPATIPDGDDDLALFAGSCATFTTFTEGGETWRIQTFRNGSGPLFVVPHDDENASLATAAAAIAARGGTVTAVETGGRRFNGRIDPNRNFDGGALSCGKPRRSPRFVAAMLPGGRPIIALHTNSPGAASTGGSGTISIRAPYAGATAFPATGPLAKDDAMVILASRNGPAGVQSLTRRLNAAGINVMVETVDTTRTDCSLSHYAVANGIPYANVEAAHGDGATQRAILDILLREM
ncbi:hypothetical protein [Acuticoccus yangtzensis]|uniref:hypothetical protein n=1 Tax=Acuticoccus yangtzensis TaxID=1443441 RepID=UPI0009495168|nr:hypothetical protein [Acuticoccus yangtzensis]